MKSPQPGIQVHGGMGYIEESGAAQYLRDARITMIYEGTNGIQALDLVKRKLIRETAAINRIFLGMNDTVDALETIGKTPALKAIGDELGLAVPPLEQATIWMQNTIPSDPIAAASGATPYCSHVWLHCCRMAPRSLCVYEQKEIEPPYQGRYCHDFLLNNTSLQQQRC